MFNWVRKVNNQECIWQQTLEFTQQTRGYKSQLAHVISPVSMSQTGVNKSIRRFCLPKDTTQLTQQLLNLSEHTAQMSTLSHCTNTWYLVIQTNIVIIPLRAQWSQVTLPESQVETQVFHGGDKRENADNRCAGLQNAELILSDDTDNHAFHNISKMICLIKATQSKVVFLALSYSEKGSFKSSSWFLCRF